jgi:hypothetical protein
VKETYDALASEYETSLFMGLIDPTTSDNALSDIAAMMVEAGKPSPLDPVSAMVFICFAAGLHGAAEGIRENGEHHRAAKLHEMAQVILNSGIQQVSDCAAAYAEPRRRILH